MDQPTKHVIFDLDNCISIDEWRIKYIRWDRENPGERYEVYHRACGLDEPANRDIFEHWARKATPVFLTGRPIAVRAVTLHWLDKHFRILDPILIMRNNGDHRKSVELKRDMVRSLHYHYDIDPIKAFDDRPEIVEMYRSFGIDAEQVFVHDPDAAYVKPLPKETT
jgi:hypothetical protein